MNCSRFRCIAAVAAWAVTSAGISAVAADPPGSIDFFENRIRPILVEHCYECHAGDASEIKGGLRLDSHDAVRRGGDSGAAIEPGKSSESLLMEAVRYEGLEMPPEGKLPESVIADFAAWIEAGAVDPRTASPNGTTTAPSEINDEHWSFRPVTRPPVPEIASEAWSQTPVDRFILAKLEAATLSPSPPADRKTLLRRLSIGLVGLPPTYEEVAAFASDDAPDAYERAVDRLLASPAYGERWGRHWLDVARYADTKDGVLMYGDDRIRPYAYTYREYVVEAFNENLPFDRFVHEQLAADLIEPPVEKDHLAAMGFLTLGRMFDNNIHDVIDDRIDVVTRGMLGLTVACARCHDHKYDPIPTADYYSMYGVFASSEAPAELPLIVDPGSIDPSSEFEKQSAEKRNALRTLVDEQYALLTETAKQRVGDYLVRVATTEPDLAETAIFFLSLQPEDLRPPMVAAWRRYIERRASSDDPFWGLWGDLIGLGDVEFAAKSQAIIAEWQQRPEGTAPGALNPLLKQAFASANLTSKADVAQLYGDLLRTTFEGSKTEPVSESDPARQQVLDVLTSRESPAYFPKSRAWTYMSRGEKDRYGALLTEIDKLAVQAPNAPPRAMVLNDSEQLYDPKIFVRGSASRPGDPVPRQMPDIATTAERTPFSHGSGRLDLAHAITAEDNPLTARVFVNRVWMHHFGQPLAESPSDFGNRCPPPTHPELLDWLASEFVASGWDVKALHRAIVLSAAYRQSSTIADLGLAVAEANTGNPRSAFANPQSVDPENKLLSHANRRRLDLEAMRDSLLAISGRLNPAIGGRPVDATDAANSRRTIYGLVDRQSLPGMYRAFDFASPDQSADKRPRTTVPQQALFSMNSPFMIEQAKALAARAEIAAELEPAKRVAALTRAVLLREPTLDEITAGVTFVTTISENAGVSQLNPWQQYAQVLLMTNESMFVD